MSRDCWSRARKHAKKSSAITLLLILSLLSGFVFGISYFIYLFPASSHSEIASIVFPSLCLLSLLIFISTFVYIIHISHGKNDPNRMFINCISQYYHVLKSTDEYEDFKKFIDSGEAAVVEYDWVKWLILPVEDRIMIIGRVNTKHSNFHIGEKMSEFNFLSKGRDYVYPPIIFSPISSDNLTNISPQHYGYYGVYYVCESEDVCELVSEILEGMKRHRHIYGVSLAEIYSKRYIGISAKIPESREEFELLLSYISDLRSMISLG